MPGSALVVYSAFALLTDAYSHQLLAQSVLGTIPNWILVAMALFVAFRVSRGGGGSAVSELAAANKVLEQRLHEERVEREKLGAEIRDLRVDNASLAERTDFASALDTRAREAEARALQALTAHEERAIDRHDEQMRQMRIQSQILQMMADALARLGVHDEDDGS